MKKYRAAIVGLGRIASTFANDKKRKGISTHAQAYLNHPRVDLVAACDMDATRLADFGATWGVKNLYSNLHRMLSKEKVDILSICTWNSTHAQITKKALACGVKAIICEKPIADSLKNADQMIASCRKHRTPLFVNYTRRYVSLNHKIRRMIESGEMGTIQSVSCYYTAGAVNTGTHLFDLLRYFFGEISWVWADPDHVFGEEDKNYSGYLHFKKGFGCTLSAMDVKNYLIFDMDIFGSKKRIRLTQSGTQAQVWSTVPHPLFMGYSDLKPQDLMRGDLGEGLPGLIQNAIDSIDGRQNPHCSGEDGRAALEVACALRQSAQKMGRKINLPIQQTSMKMSSR